MKISWQYWKLPRNDGNNLRFKILDHGRCDQCHKKVQKVSNFKDFPYLTLQTLVDIETQVHNQWDENIEVQMDFSRSSKSSCDSLFDSQEQRQNDPKNSHEELLMAEMNVPHLDEDWSPLLSVIMVGLTLEKKYVTNMELDWFLVQFQPITPNINPEFYVPKKGRCF
ncbi:hypothetical protein GOP47_0020288 [Adiantum capillus-veneris]|uniref:Uncharacterized protein n=1 Tax=Adiantum capillus-veneris TaxID=13818 RepID=A0A9D4UCP4_ADICA|nr:hypothetical protein GOP47_0020288 [Adiantum capillus-veneris]